MKKSAIFWSGWFLLFLVGGIAFLNQQRPHRLAKLFPAPSFEITGVTVRDVKPFRSQDLAGHPWVASFIYTRCAGPCPLLTARMAELQKRLPAVVHLVSFSVDPDGDTPQKLQEYATQFKADPERWTFARSDVRTLYKLLYEGFRLPIAQDPSAGEGYRITHSTRLVLVDAQGMIRGYYDGASPETVRSLQRAVQSLLREAA
jgi:protein SCO1/2